MKVAPNFNSLYSITEKRFEYEHHDLYGFQFVNYEFDFAFRSREEYIDFRTAWREEYRQLSELIRVTRQAFRHRHRVEGGMQTWRETWDSIQRYCTERELEAPLLEDENLKWQLKAHARFLLQLRHASKNPVASQL